MKRPVSIDEHALGASLRELVVKALHPGLGAGATIVVIATLGLVWCFAFGGQQTPLAYVFYAFSAYALAVVVAALVGPARGVVEKVLLHPVISLVAGDEGLRAGASGAWSTLYDLAYAVFIMVTGFRYDSGWAIAVALYHVAIAGIGFAMAYGLRGARRLPTAEERRIRELRLVRTCGVLLSVMALALAFVMGQMVARGQAWVYSTVVVITIAAFTFTSLTLAIVSVAKVRRVESPSLVATRSVALSKTLVQLFFLETTMIAVFGGPDSGGEGFRLIMEGITGAVVFMAIVAIAILLMAYATRKLRGESADV